MAQATATAATNSKANTASATKPARPRILVVDDDKIILDSLCEFLRLEEYEVDSVNSVEAATTQLGRNPYHLVITDVNMPRSDGFELLNILRQRHPEVVAVVITGYGTIESAVEAIKMGAFDYLTKPIVDDEIKLVVQRALQQQSLLRENRALKQQLQQRYGLDSVIGQDYRMVKLFDIVEAAADTKTTVLITGESGTGKSLMARAIHQRSSRRDKPFIEVSCGSIPEALLESELFGHAKGAFTGAVSDKDGKFKAAEGGTIFLDEINSASQAFQVKLLRVLQERRYEPVGSNNTIQADVRVIVATNVDLNKEVEAGRFRQDLFYRVNVVTIGMPSLVERLGDIPRLVESFLARCRAEVGKEVIDVTPEAMNTLQRYHWPGNVRELENCIERAVVLCKGRHITVEDLPAHIVEETAKPGAAAAARPGAKWTPMTLKDALEEPERQIIEAALRANGWNRQTTAEVLDINRTTLYKKMKKFGLEFEPGA